MATLLDWVEQQLSHKTTDDTQPNTQPDSLECVDTGNVTPGAGQSIDIAADEALAASIPTPESSPKPTPLSPSPLELLVAGAVTDQARTLGVLASRVETLESQLAVLQHERDRALDQLTQAQSVPTQLTQQLENLQAENTRLRSELDRFEAIRRAFLGETPPPQSADDTKASAPASETPAVDTTSDRAIANPSKSSPKPKSDSAASANKSVSVAKRSGRPRPRGAALARAQRIFHALIAWNEQHPDDTFAMTDWLLEGVFNVNRKAAKQFCQQFHDAITQHHSTIGIDNIKSHNRGWDTSALKTFVDNFTGAA